MRKTSRWTWLCHLRVAMCWALSTAILTFVSPLCAQVLPPNNAHLNPPSLDADTMLLRGLDSFDRGDLSSAIDQWKDATGMYQAIGSLSGQCNGHRNLATAYRALGQFESAWDELTLAKQLAQDLGDRRQQIVVLSDLGSLATLTRRWQTAESDLRLALEMSAQDIHRREHADVLFKVGNLHLAQGSNSLALKRYQQSADVAARVKEPAVAARAFSNGAVAAIRLASFRQAHRLLDRGARLDDETPRQL